MVSVATELLVVIGTRSQLQPEYRLGIDEMLLPLPTPLVVAARFEGAVGQTHPCLRIRAEVTSQNLLSDLGQADPLDATRRSGEVLINEFLR